MSTFGQMTDAVLSELRSHVRDQEQSTHLTSSITSGDFTLTVASTAGMSRGRVEIDDELLWIDSADHNGFTATVPPYGRGMDGSTAAAHSSGARVVIAPAYPRQVVKNKINESIAVVGATLFGVATTALTPSPTKYIYELPAAAIDVLSVKVSDVRAGGEVVYLRNWSLDKNAPATLSTTGKALYVKDSYFSSPTKIEVVYTTDPVKMSASTDNFSTTLLPSSSEDVVTLLTISRLVASAEAYNLMSRSVEASALEAKQQPGRSMNVSKYYYALYQQRLAEERRRLLDSANNRVHYVH